MSEMTVIRIIRKITRIVIKQLPSNERYANSEYLKIPAFIFADDRETLCVNPDFEDWFKRSVAWDNENIWTAIITHEDIHRILMEFADQEADNDVEYDKLDNIAPNITKSMFFVDCEWIWLSLRS